MHRVSASRGSVSGSGDTCQHTASYLQFKVAHFLIPQVYLGDSIGIFINNLQQKTKNLWDIVQCCLHDDRTFWQSMSCVRPTDTHRVTAHTALA